METFLPHIQSWMQKYITEAVDRIEKNMAQHIERKILEIHQRLDAFLLRFLARPAPTIDLMTLQVVVASVREDIDATLNTRVPEFEAPSTEPVEDTVMVALFSATSALSPQPHEHTKEASI